MQGYCICMRKILPLILMLMGSLSALSQVLIPVKLDSSVTVSLPKEYRKQDTLGQQVFTANALYGYIIITRAANPPGKPLKREKDLKKELKNYQNKILSGTLKSTVDNDKDTVIANSLLARDFTLKVDTGAGVQDRQFRVVYTKNFTYTFQYLMNESQREVAIKEVKAFFSSIKFAPDVNREDQYSIIGQFTGMHKGLRMGLIAGGIVIILLIVAVIRRRKKQV